MEDKRSSTGPILAALALLLLPCLYVGAYLATVGRTVAWDDEQIQLGAAPLYSIGRDYELDALGPFFYPVHQVDRWIRPAYWLTGPMVMEMQPEVLEPASP